MSFYQQRIKTHLDCNDEEAAGVEAFLRLKYKTLDGVHGAEFKRSASAALVAVRLDVEAARELVASYGVKK